MALRRPYAFKSDNKGTLSQQSWSWGLAELDISIQMSIQIMHVNTRIMLLVLIRKIPLFTHLGAALYLSRNTESFNSKEIFGYES